MKFKVGDLVEVFGCDCELDNCSNGKFGRVEGFAGQSYMILGLGHWLEKNLRLVKKNNINISENKTKTSMLNIIEKFKALTAPEPNRTFIKAGIADANGELNSDGRQLFIEFLINKFGAEFKTEVVDPILAADENVKS